MRLRDAALLSGTLLLVLAVQIGDSTLMLTSMLVAAKTGMLVGKMSLGGLMMMLMAASNQNNHNNAGYGKKRTIRSADGNASTSTEEEEVVVRRRLVRQMDSAFDTMTCLPKFVCGMNAQTPSKKTSLMNDYGHLLKIMLLPEELNDDADDSEEQADELDDEESKLVKDENDKMEEMAHEALIDDDPGMLPFVLKEVTKMKNKKKKGNNRNGLNEREDELPMRRPRPPPRPRPSPFSISSYLPKIEAGLGTKSSDPAFDNDPFFDGFKRSLSDSVKNLEEHGMKEGSVSIIDDQDDVENFKPMSRQARSAFIRRMSTKLSKVRDPVEKYKIAEEVGKKMKTQEACTKVFKKCPYKWEEVMGMVGNLKNVITAHPVVEAIMADPNKNNNKTASSFGDKVVYLKGSDGQPNMVTIKTQPQPMKPDGMTTVVHDLGNGNMLQISMMVMNPNPGKPEKAKPAVANDTKKPAVTIDNEKPVVTNENTASTELETEPEAGRPIILEDPGITSSSGNLTKLAATMIALHNKNVNGSWTSSTKKPVRPKPLILPALLDDAGPADFVDDEREDFVVPPRLKPDMVKLQESLSEASTPVEITVKRKVGSNNRDKYVTAEDYLDEDEDDAEADDAEDEDEDAQDDDDLEDEERSRKQQESAFKTIASTYNYKAPSADFRRQAAAIIRQPPIPIKQVIEPTRRRYTATKRRSKLVSAASTSM